MFFTRAILPILLLSVMPLSAQSWLGYKYIGGVPTHRIFGRPAEYCNGVNLEQFTKNILGDSSKTHDWRFGIQGELLIGNGIKQNNYFPTVSPSEQQLKLSRIMVGGSLSTRYTFLEKTLQPYGEFSVGIRNFSSTLNITPGTFNSGSDDYSANSTYLNYTFSTGFIYPISKTVKLDLGINYHLGKKAELYDFNSAYASGGSIKAKTVEVGTSSLQFEFGLLINYRRKYYNSIYGNRWGLLDLLFL